MVSVMSWIIVSSQGFPIKALNLLKANSIFEICVKGLVEWLGVLFLLPAIMHTESGMKSIVECSRTKGLNDEVAQIAKTLVIATRGKLNSLSFM
jgi:hypothetical protein